ncbi:MAG: YceI family protein [Saprospiraceae bacterium]
MKKLFFLLFAVGTLSFVACNNETKSAEQETEGAEQTEFPEETGKVAIYNFDRDNSYVTWKASKAVGGSHHGKVLVSDGRVAVEGGNIYGGETTIDMATIAVEDEDASTTENLTGHLKSPDFFDVEKYPFSTFQIVQIQPFDGSEGYNFTLRGDLRVKEVSKPVTIPCSVSITPEKVTIKSPPFTINRTEWGINYNSGILGTVADKIINDDIELTINVVANRRQLNALFTIYDI